MDNATDFTKNDFVILWPNAMKIHLLDDINQRLSNTNILVIIEPYRYNFKTCNEFIYQKNVSLIKHLHASNYQNTFAFECNNYLGRICYNKNGSINNKGKACLSRALLDFIKKCKDSVVRDHDNIVEGRESVIMESEENRDSSNLRQELQIAEKSTTTRGIGNFSEDNQEAISDNHHFFPDYLSWYWTLNKGRKQSERKLKYFKQHCSLLRFEEL
ncbi:hypothetical protein JTB14_031546 [Gonioctena quinquepunctata]|nr:hypothetical protein JTB14_031546 [Gonioctena quinquepunctata]